MKTPPAVIILGAGAVLVGGAAAAAASVRRVKFIEHANGTHPALRALLSRWNDVGTHTVTVAPADTDWEFPGGLRTDEATQAAASDAKLSGASSLRQTPHGRGAALDVWPEGFNPRRGFDVQPGMKPLFEVFGQWAETVSVIIDGHPWTFRWLGHIGDLPHVELVGWAQLPFPPPAYGGGFV